MTCLRRVAMRMVSQWEPVRRDDGTCSWWDGILTLGRFRRFNAVHTSTVNEYGVNSSSV